MKRDRHGQSTPITSEFYKKIRIAMGCDRDRLILDLAYFTGERWGAIVALKVDDCYCDSGKPREFITYRASNRKDRQTRQVPVVDELRLRLQCYSPPPEGWLFPSRQKTSANQHISFRTASTALENAIRRCGLDDMGISTHGTRHHFVTSLASAGYSTAMIQSITGHASLASLQRYIHLDPSLGKSAIATALG